MKGRLYEEVGGVEWCRTHHGIVDEIGPNRTDDGGNRQCDMVDGDAACTIEPLWIEATP